MLSKLGPRARRSRPFPLPRLRVRSKNHTQRQSLSLAPPRRLVDDVLVLLKRKSTSHDPSRTPSRGNPRSPLSVVPLSPCPRLPRPPPPLATRAVLAARVAPRRKYPRVRIRRSPRRARVASASRTDARASRRHRGALVVAPSIATTRDDATRARTRARAMRVPWKITRERARERARRTRRRARAHLERPAARWSDGVGGHGSFESSASTDRERWVGEAPARRERGRRATTTRERNAVSSRRR